MSESSEEKQARYEQEDAAPGMAELRAKRDALVSAAAEKAIDELGIARRTLDAARAPSPTDAIATVTSFEGSMLVLSGHVGCGKSVAAAKWIIDRITGPSCWKLSRLLDGAGRTVDYAFAPKGKHLGIWTSAAKLARVDHYDEEAIARFTTALNLVVDDMLVEYLDAKGFYLSLLDEILNERYGNRLPTVMTTNLDTDGFKARYGERIADRIREAGKFVCVGTTSLRGKAA